MTGALVAVVDDDDTLCSSLVDLMRSVGYRAEPYSSAETCLTSPNLLNWDCIVADVHMPGVDGLNLVRKLRALGIKTPVILMTALPDKQLDDDAISVGALGPLRKPFSTNALFEQIEKGLSNKLA